MVEEWVDHSLDAARKAEKAYENAKESQAEADKKLKETFSQLSEMEKAYHNAEFALKGYERQASEALEAQRKVESTLALTVVELKQAKQ